MHEHSSICKPKVGGLLSDNTDMLTVSELAALLRIGRNTAYEVVRSGALPSLKIGRQIRISKQAVLDYIAHGKGDIKP